MKLYVMCDRVSGKFGSIYEDYNDDSVRRNFKMMCESNDIPRHILVDTVVFCLGEFDDNPVEPKIIPCIPKVICRGDEYEYSCAREENISASGSPDC